MKPPIAIEYALMVLSGAIEDENIGLYASRMTVVRVEDGAVFAKDGDGGEHKLALNIRCRIGFDPDININGPALCATNVEERTKIGSMIVVLFAVSLHGSSQSLPVRWVDEAKAKKMLHEYQTVPVARVSNKENEVVWIGFERNLPPDLDCYDAQVRTFGSTTTRVRRATIPAPRSEQRRPHAVRQHRSPGANQLEAAFAGSGKNM